MSPRPWIATYRLQLHREFPLAAAAEVLPYLARLGISHVYLSPCLQAHPGSTHGYDVVDPTRISEDLGGEAAWTEFQRAVRTHGLGVLLDIVPNHMATTDANPWWNDVLQHGPYSAHGGFFDLSPCADGERWHVRLCVLPQPYGEVLQAGKFGVDLEGDEPWLTCEGQRWPLNPLTWHQLAGQAAAGGDPATRYAWRDRLLPDDEARGDYATAVAEARARWEELGKPSLRKDALLRSTEAVTRDPDRLHALIAAQYYRPVWWRREGELVNYRRFFNIGSLVGLRVEDEAVFTAAHARIGKMVTAGEVDGLRIDHPDGLRDPGAYLARLRALLPEGRIYVEKILDAEEDLPASWQVDGTVGYDFLSKVNRLWMAGETSDQLTAIYADFTGHTVNFPALVREKKLAIIESAFGADRERLVDLALRIARSHWRTQDLSGVQLRRAIGVVSAILPVYRTYLPGATEEDRARDLALLDATLAQAAAFAREVEADVFSFLREVLADPHPEGAAADFIARWQQLAPAAMAKGSEDTTFYLYDRLVSGNEVGSQPSALGISAEQFHAYGHRVQTHWPLNQLATSTHDNKRSEDVRLRISLLTEITERWSQAVQEWSRLNQDAWRGRTPDRHAEYLLYQTLVGAWPLSAERATAYMLKACREAKVRTSWHEPNADYEAAIDGFVRRVVESPEFVASLEAFIAPLLQPAHVHSLAQTLIKLTFPGVPDFYQGTELWDLSLVDPDNRRPVDFAARREWLERAQDWTPAQVLAEEESGLPKLWLIARVLSFRRQHAGLFGPEQSYEPLMARGPRLAHVLGYRRGERLVVLVPRFVLTCGGAWADTALTLPEGTWRELFSGQVFSGDVPVAQLWSEFPVALLFRDESDEDPS